MSTKFKIIGGDYHFFPEGTIATCVSMMWLDCDLDRWALFVEEGGTILQEMRISDVEEVN